MKKVLCFAATAMFLFSVSCGSSSSNTASQSPATPTPAAAPSGSSSVQPQSPKAQSDPCSLFSPADAQEITGVPMKLSPGHGDVCMYEEASPKPGMDTVRVSLMLNAAGSMEEEDREWKNTKDVRRLKPGEKSVAKLSGIGDEAWFYGNAENGKVAVGGIMARKGKADFALQSSVVQYRSSLEKMKDTAKRIAGRLP